MRQGITQLHALQALQIALRTGPFLLVLDNISTAMARAAQPFLGPMPSGSLMLATSWYRGAFSDVCTAQAQHGQHSFRDVHMADHLVLRTPDAEQLIQQEIKLSRATVKALQALSTEELQKAAETTAAALWSSTPPAYVPKVLSVVARTLGRTAHQPGALDKLMADLRTAQEPRVRGYGSLPSAEGRVFDQLKLCYSLLPSEAQQLFVDLAEAHRQQADQSSLAQLSLWLSCRQQDPCSMEDARDEVRVCPSEHAVKILGSPLT